MGAELAAAFAAAREVFEEVDDALGAAAVPADAGGTGRDPHPHRERPAGADGGQRGRGAGAASASSASASTRRRSSPAIRWANIPPWRPPAPSAWPTRRGCLSCRGQAMQAAVPPGEGAMAALIGPRADVALAEEAAEAGRRGRGLRRRQRQQRRQRGDLRRRAAAIEAAIEQGQGTGRPRHPAERLGALPLSADAAGRRRDGRGSGRDTRSSPPRAPAGRQRHRPADPRSRTTIRRLLVEQVTGRVRWRESIAWMAARAAWPASPNWAPARC